MHALHCLLTNESILRIVAVAFKDVSLMSNLRNSIRMASSATMMMLLQDDCHNAAAAIKALHAAVANPMGALCSCAHVM